MDDHDWLTLHRVKFAEDIDGRGKPLPGPASAEIWRFAPESPVGENGFRTDVGDVWGGFALYDSKAKADAVFEDPQAHLPLLDGTVEAWHALVVPFAHRGGVQWRDTVQHDCAIRVAPSDPEGPLVVMTSAGYVDPGPQDFDRMRRFTRGIDEVLDYYGTLTGNLRRGLFSGLGVDGREGGTISLWRDDQSMIAAAYKSGGHKSQMDDHNASPLFDHSSFTRGRVVSSRGMWDGANPMDAFAGQRL